MDIWWHWEKLTDLRQPAWNNPASKLGWSRLCCDQLAVGKADLHQLLDDFQRYLRSIITSFQSQSMSCTGTKLRLHSRVDSFNMLQNWQGSEIWKLLISLKPNETVHWLWVCVFCRWGLRLYSVEVRATPWRVLFLLRFVIRHHSIRPVAESADAETVLAMEISNSGERSLFCQWLSATYTSAQARK